MSPSAAGIATRPETGEDFPPETAEDPSAASLPESEFSEQRSPCDTGLDDGDAARWYASPMFVSCSCSTVLHMIVLAACSFIWFLLPDEPLGAGIDSQLLESTLAEPPKPVELSEITPPTEADIALTSGGESRTYLKRPAPKLEISPRAVTPLTTTATDAEWISEDVTQTYDLVGSALARISSDGNGNGTGDGEGDGTGGMFGLRPVGKRFVYVLDCSRSMNHPHDSEAKTRFKRMQMELLNSVKTMSAEQEFYFIFFNDYVIRMPSRNLVPASHDLKVKYLTWMARLQADGNTEPKGALYAAMKLNPDVIYFLTDGTFDYRIEQELLDFPKTRATVHTFAVKEHLTEDMREVYSLFDTNDGAKARKLVSLKEFRKTRAVWRAHQLLRKLADKHNGTFKIIP